ncbi:MAG: helix-turn-helix domain-containing protein, partial [Haloglomus sp.]
RATIRTGEAGASGERSEAVDPAALLAALDDAPCRRILRVAGDRAVTVRELAATCDIPAPTCYRKTRLLTEARLLERRTRPRADGNHASEYVRRVDSVVVEMDGAAEG